MSINRWMDKDVVYYIYNGILLSHKKGRQKDQKNHIVQMKKSKFKEVKWFSYINTVSDRKRLDGSQVSLTLRQNSIMPSWWLPLMVTSSWAMSLVFPNDLSLMLFFFSPLVILLLTSMEEQTTASACAYHYVVVQMFQTWPLELLQVGSIY